MGCCAGRPADDGGSERGDGADDQPVIKFKAEDNNDNDAGEYRSDEREKSESTQPQTSGQLKQFVEAQNTSTTRPKSTLGDSPDTADISHLVSPPTLFCTLSSDVHRSPSATPPPNPLTPQAGKLAPTSSPALDTLDATCDHPSLSPSCSYQPEKSEYCYDERRIRLENWLDGMPLSPVALGQVPSEGCLILTAENVDKNRHILQKIAKAAAEAC